MEILQQKARLYSAALYAQRDKKQGGTEAAYAPSIIFGGDTQEAVDEAIDLCKGKFSAILGWYGHNAVVVEIPYSVITTALRYHPEKE